MKRLSDLYASSAVEGLVEGFKCGVCKKEAFQRCKRCKSVWYCGRDCQVGDWPRHKADCKKIQDQAKEEQARQQQQQAEQAHRAEQDKHLITELD
jgi:hypothetical protein